MNPASNTLQLDRWRFDLDDEIVDSAVIVGERAWVITRRIEGENPVTARLRVYEQDGSGSAKITKERTVRDPSFEFVAASNGDRALVSWLEGSGAARSVHFMALNGLGEPVVWNSRPPKGVDPIVAPHLIARDGATGWLVCVETAGDVQDIYCSAVTDGADGVPSWHRSKLAGKPRALGMVRAGGAPQLLAQVCTAPTCGARRVVAIELHEDGAPAGGARDVTSDLATEVIGLGNDVLLASPSLDRYVLWNGTSAETAAGKLEVPVVGLRAGDATYLATVSGLQPWVNRAPKQAPQPWPRVIHQELGTRIQFIKPVLAGGAVLSGYVDGGARRALIVRPRPG